MSRVIEVRDNADALIGSRTVSDPGVATVPTYAEGVTWAKVAVEGRNAAFPGSPYYGKDQTSGEILAPKICYLCSSSLP